MVPVGLQVNHIFIDGIHLSRFGGRCAAALRRPFVNQEGHHRIAMYPAMIMSNMAHMGGYHMTTWVPIR